MKQPVPFVHLAPKHHRPEMWHLIGIAKLDARDVRILERRTSPKGLLDKAINLAELAMVRSGIRPVVPVTSPECYDPTSKDIEAFELETEGRVEPYDGPRMRAIHEAVVAKQTEEFAAEYGITFSEVYTRMGIRQST